MRYAIGDRNPHIQSSHRQYLILALTNTWLYVCMDLEAWWGLRIKEDVRVGGIKWDIEGAAGSLETREGRCDSTDDRWMMHSAQTPVVQRVLVLHPRVCPLFILITHSMTGSRRIHRVPTEKQPKSYQAPREVQLPHH